MNIPFFSVLEPSIEYRPLPPRRTAYGEKEDISDAARSVWRSPTFLLPGSKIAAAPSMMWFVIYDIFRLSVMKIMPELLTKYIPLCSSCGLPILSLFELRSSHTDGVGGILAGLCQEEEMLVCSTGGFQSYVCLSDSLASC